MAFLWPGIATQGLMRKDVSLFQTRCYIIVEVLDYFAKKPLSSLRKSSSQARIVKRIAEFYLDLMLIFSIMTLTELVAKFKKEDLYGITLEKIELVKDRTGVSYRREAKSAFLKKLMAWSMLLFSLRRI